jgi:hypothetical protein
VKKQAHDFAFFNPGIEEDDLVSRGYLTLVAEREEHDKGLKRLNYDRLTRYCFEETRALKSRMPLPNAETEERPADSRSGQIFGNHGTAYRPTPDDYDAYSLAQSGSHYDPARIIHEAEETPTTRGSPNAERPSVTSGWRD